MYVLNTSKCGLKLEKAAFSVPSNTLIPFKWPLLSFTQFCPLKVTCMMVITSSYNTLFHVFHLILVCEVVFSTLSYIVKNSGLERTNAKIVDPLL